MKRVCYCSAACLVALACLSLLSVTAGAPAPASGEPILVGTIQPMSGPYAAFGVKEGDKLWLPPERRVRIW